MNSYKVKIFLEKRVHTLPFFFGNTKGRWNLSSLCNFVRQTSCSCIVLLPFVIFILVLCSNIFNAFYIRRCNSMHYNILLCKFDGGMCFFAVFENWSCFCTRWEHNTLVFESLIVLLINLKRMLTSSLSCWAYFLV